MRKMSARPSRTPFCLRRSSAAPPPLAMDGRIGLLAIICAAMIWSGLLAAIIFLVASVIEVAAVISGESEAGESERT